MSRTLTDAQAVARLQRILEAQPARGMKAWADAVGLNYTYVMDVAKGRRPMSDGIAAALGLKRVHGWVEAK